MTKYNSDKEYLLNANVLIQYKYNEVIIEQIQTILNRCNYFIWYNDINEQYSEMIVEQQYQTIELSDYVYNDLDGIVYHITTLIAYEKIKKFGLCPKHKDKKVFHPARVYFTIADDEKYLKILGNDLYPDLNFIVLQIDLKKNPVIIKLFLDPACADTGIFTYENISPDCISQKIFS